tara:strand:+ start:295 stop:603 length:309 start_codon:yes stop_codon:yes gene_type:complete
MKHLLLAPLIFSLSFPVQAAETKAPKDDIFDPEISTGGMMSICLAHSKRFISKRNAIQMISIISNDAKKKAKPINQWEPFKAAVEEKFVGNFCQQFLYLLKD